MASGHVNRANRPNTWLHRSDLQREKVLANLEPSTHGTKRQFAPRKTCPELGVTPTCRLTAGTSDFEDKADFPDGHPDFSVCPS
jgi:hypothetical protein